MRRASFASSLTLCKVWFFASTVVFAQTAPALTCDPVPVDKPTGNRDQIAARARATARSGRNSEARSLFNWLIEQNPNDQEAWLGISQVNAWDRCLDKAEQGYRILLSRNPRDVEARAGLIDVLMWQSRWDETQANLDEGLGLSPNAPDLLLREAKLTFWSGNATLAADQLDNAVQKGARGEEVKLLRRQVYLEQLRTVMRVDSFPAGYANIYTWGMQALYRAQRFELTLGTILYRHSGGVDPLLIDGRHSAGIVYHPGIGSLAGLSVGFGAPVHFVPTVETKAFALFPVGRVFSGYFAYALWQYGTHKSVHIFAPAFAYSLRDDFHLELRWWTSYVVLHTQPGVGDSARTGLVHSVGLLGRVQLAPDLNVGATYTYGIQLDENPIISRLFPLRSHIAALFSDWVLGDHIGMQPLFGFERRQAPYTVVTILSAEMGVCWRW